MSGPAGGTEAPEHGPVNTTTHEEHVPQKNLIGSKARWMKSDYGFNFVENTYTNLPPGVYETASHNDDFYLTPVSFVCDAAFDLPGLPTGQILDQIKDFWKREAIYKKFGFLHKRGLLLYGEPGCGKSSIIALLIRQMLDLGGAVVLIDNFYQAAKVIPQIRMQEKPIPVLTICEDLDQVLSDRSRIPYALSFYDGQKQSNGIFHIATTNDPSSLEDRFIKRPGRFDIVIGMHPPAEETRRAYLQSTIGKLGATAYSIEHIVAGTDGMGFSYLREVISAHFVLEEPLGKVLDRLRKNFTAKMRPTRTGFTIGYSGEESQ